MKQNLDFTEIKEFCDKVGLNCQIIDEGVIITKPKDIWDGVEFALNPKGFVRKIEKIEHGLIYFIGDFWYHKNVCKPSTESAYIEQLKKECFGKHNDKLESSKIDDSNMNGGRIRFEAGQGDSFQYRKDIDTLYWCGIPVYQSGKWATRVKERVKVVVGCRKDGHGATFSFNFSNLSEYPDFFKMEEFLASQLEDYLNK